MEHAVWRINPLIKQLMPMNDPWTGGCLLPEELPHCHAGSETQHADGYAECIGWEECEAPGPGRHGHIHQCEPEVNHLYAHRCGRCRR